MAKKGEELPLLIAQAGVLIGQRWSLRGSLVIGRDPTCEIVIPDGKFRGGMPASPSPGRVSCWRTWGVRTVRTAMACASTSPYS